MSFFDRLEIMKREFYAENLSLKNKSYNSNYFKSQILKTFDFLNSFFYLHKTVEK